jgi:hypothetical protein
MRHTIFSLSSEKSPICLQTSKQASTLLATCFMLVSSALKTEATQSSETLVDIHWFTWHYVSGNRTLHNHRCESLKYSNEYVQFTGPPILQKYEEWLCTCDLPTETNIFLLYSKFIGFNLPFLSSRYVN